MNNKLLISIDDMPKSCSDCKFLYDFHGVSKCRLLNELENGGKAIISCRTIDFQRKECCPLVSKEEVKNAIIDEFVKEICIHYTSEEASQNYKHYCCEIKQTIADMAEELKEEI